MMSPGQDIRPPTSLDVACELVKQRYGLQVVEITEMVSYDDRNYRLKVTGESFTLKVTNCLDSRDPQLFDVTTEIQGLLESRGVAVPRPVEDMEGRLWSLVQLGGEQYAVRLQTYLPGLPLGQVPFSTELLKDWGRTLGNFHLGLQGYRNTFLEQRDHMWRLPNVTKLSGFLHAVPEASRRVVVETVVRDFEREVLPWMPRLQHGVLHGDLNENNVLADGPRVVGVLDFGDMYWGPLVLDVAVMLTYTLLKPGDSAPLSRATPCLQGYVEVRPLSDLELKLLKVCVAARLCQSLVLGAYTALLHPDNKAYVLTTSETGWTVLDMVLSLPDSSSWPLDV